MKKLNKKQLIEKWIEALRSGEYKQGREILLEKDRYCCLGVLCDISKEQFNLKTLATKHGFRNSRETFYGTPPLRLQKFLGLKKLNKDGTNSIIDELIDMNDTQGKRFKTIAKYLEKELL